MPGQPLSRPRRQLPFQESLYDAPLPPLKGEVPAARAEGYANADFGNFDLWFPKSSIKPAEARVGNADL